MRRVCLCLLSLLMACLSGSKPPQPQKPAILPSLAQKTAGLPCSKGMISLHGEGPTALWEFTPHALTKNYLWSPHVSGGLGSFILTGQGGSDRVVRFERRGNILLARQVQSVFTVDAGRPEGLGIEENYRAPVIATLPIIAETDGALLVSGEKFLKSFNWEIISYLEQELKGQRATDSLRIITHELCPENMEWDLEVDLDLKPDSPLPKMTPLPDPRRVTLGLHWSLRTIPDSDYTPRRADPLVGYFTVTSKNLSRPTSLMTNENRIVRWNIRRKNPDIFTTGDVAKPIVYWVSKNTPHEFRDVIREGVLEWNKAFEAAGFRGALDCRIQPDDATWSLSDCRYNVIQWITSHKLHFAGHGPVTENPFTGEILRAHIRIDGESFHGMETGPTLLSVHSCHAQDAGACLPALAHLLSAGANDPIHDIFRQYLKRVVIHEVGHTLGLRHNFKGSTALPFAKVHDTAYTRTHGLSASIMDYAVPNLHPDPTQQGDYFSTVVGPYDMWAIRYGYAHDPMRAEEDLLQSILKNPLPYATDEDANHDPYAAQYDGTDNPLADASLQQGALEKCLERFADVAILAGGDPGIRRQVFRGVIRRWFSYPKSHPRFLGGQIYWKGATGRSGHLTDWVDPKVEREALASILAPLNGERQEKWSRNLDNLPRLTLDDWSRDHEPLLMHYRQEIESHHRDLINGTLHPEVFNRLRERALRHPESRGLTQGELVSAFEESAFNPETRESWRRMNAALFVQRLMDLEADPAMNPDGKALVHDQLSCLRDGRLKVGNSLGESRESEAVRKLLLWQVERHFKPEGTR